MLVLYVTVITHFFPWYVSERCHQSSRRRWWPSWRSSTSTPDTSAGWKKPTWRILLTTRWASSSEWVVEFRLRVLWCYESVDWMWKAWLTCNSNQRDFPFAVYTHRFLLSNYASKVCGNLAQILSILRKSEYNGTPYVCDEISFRPKWMLLEQCMHLSTTRVILG